MRESITEIQIVVAQKQRPIEAPGVTNFLGKLIFWELSICEDLITVLKFQMSLNNSNVNVSKNI